MSDLKERVEEIRRERPLYGHAGRDFEILLDRVDELEQDNCILLKRMEEYKALKNELDEVWSYLIERLGEDFFKRSTPMIEWVKQLDLDQHAALLLLCRGDEEMAKKTTLPDAVEKFHHFANRLVEIIATLLGLVEHDEDDSGEMLAGARLMIEDCFPNGISKELTAQAWSRASTLGWLSKHVKELRARLEKYEGLGS